MNNINISGAGKIDGGEYGTIKISGASKAQGDIKAESVRVSGSAKFTGTVQADEIRVSGSCHFEKSVKADQMSISGSCRINGEIEAEIIKISGTVVVDADINVDNFTVEIGRGSSFQNIFGDIVTIHSHVLVSAKEIEATTIDVDNLKAHRISGEKVTVRGDSDIDIVEYRESLEIEEGTKIRKVVKL